MRQKLIWQRIERLVKIESFIQLLAAVASIPVAIIAMAEWKYWRGLDWGQINAVEVMAFGLAALTMIMLPSLWAGWKARSFLGGRNYHEVVQLAPSAFPLLAIMVIVAIFVEWNTGGTGIPTMVLGAILAVFYAVEIVICLIIVYVVRRAERGYTE